MSDAIRRRLAAIVAADVAGYSWLMAADEEATLQALRGHRHELIDPSIQAHGGRIANTSGDSLLLEFPSAVDAVRCVAEIQQGMVARNAGREAAARILFRVAVHVAARIEALAEPGGMVISEDAHRQVRDRLDIEWADGGAHRVKNLARPVQVWHWRRAKAGHVPLPADKPSIAVLPFDNMSGDPEQDFFADGIAEDIITMLSKAAGLMVIARTSTFAYKGRAVDVREVGRELGVRYVLEGSTRTASTRLRLTAQLVDTVDGDHVWAERYDRAIEDVFDLQDDITRHIVTALRVRLTDGEAAAFFGHGTTNIDAWRLVSQASISATPSAPKTTCWPAGWGRRPAPSIPTTALPGPWSA